MQDFRNRAHGVAKEISRDAIGDFYSMFHMDKCSLTPCSGRALNVSKTIKYGYFTKSKIMAILEPNTDITNTAAINTATNFFIS